MAQIPLNYEWVWADTGVSSDTVQQDYEAGWDYIGIAPPTVSQFNAVMNLQDRRAVDLETRKETIINVDAKLAALLEATHPIGTVVFRANDVDPNSQLPGTWVSQGTDHSIHAVGLGNGAGEVTGVNDVVMKVPQHNHSGSFSGNALGNHNHTGSFSGSAVGAHYHLTITSNVGGGTLTANNYVGNYGPGNDNNFFPNLAGNGNYPNVGRSASAGAHTPAGSVSVGSKSAGTPSGSVTVNNNGTAGATLNVVGAVFKVVAWERTL